MRIPILFALLVACGPKEAPVPAPAAAAEPTPAPAPATDEADEGDDAEAAAQEPAEAPSNADLTMTITRADGSTVAGHVKRIERSSDWFADEGWDDDAKKLKMDGETSSAAKDIRWADVKTVTIKPGTVPANVDCYYDSAWSPWMYDCTLDTTATAMLKDGSKWEVVNRHKWKMTFDDGNSVEFWLRKHPAREQDAEKVDLDTVDPQNYDLYTSLQQRLREESKTSMVVKVNVQ